MTERKQVVIFDDEEGLRQEWTDKLLSVPGFNEGFTVQMVSESDFRYEVKDLYRRRKEARAGGTTMDSRNLFDEISILIIDYDLFNLDETGEDVAYLARCYSDCGLIIGVNQFAKEGFAFDLTLQGHVESFADLNLLVDQVFDAGLWKTPWQGFRPWNWPEIPKAVVNFEHRVQDVRDNIDSGIFEFLQIPAEIREIFPTSALEFMHSEKVTFRDFVQESGSALRRKDIVPERTLARIAAARVFKCLERLVLPGQNIFVDAAHLLERFPSLFRGPAESLLAWKDTHELLNPGNSIMDIQPIDEHRFIRSHWLSRAAWYWPKVSANEGIVEVADPWTPRQQLAFCEDTSLFVHPDNAVEFVAKVDSPFVRRYVSKRDPSYGPQLQFAL